MTRKFIISSIDIKYNLVYISAYDVDDPSKRVCISTTQDNFASYSDEHIIVQIEEAFKQRYPESNDIRTLKAGGASNAETVMARINYSVNTLEAYFVTDVLEGTSPLEVVFVNKSTGLPDSYEWDFGDGGTSQHKSPIHIYETPGTYTVTLTVYKDGESHTITKQNLITVT